ncbi:hypothetical protein D3C72_2004650 [compost metagenome]
MAIWLAKTSRNSEVAIATVTPKRPRQRSSGPTEINRTRRSCERRLATRIAVKLHDIAINALENPAAVGLKSHRCCRP